MPLPIKLSLHHKRNGSEKKTTFIEAICHNFEKRRVDFFQDYPNVICFNIVRLLPSMLLFPFAVFLLCCSAVVIAMFHSTFWTF